jgi:chorismate synthase
MIRFLTSGESHGKCLTLILEGIPSGLYLTTQDIDKDLRRRQIGYGRGGRMKIETDHAEITAGIRAGVTLGSPVAVTIQNKDWENWRQIMSPEANDEIELDTDAMKITKPRPGHADLAGGIKYHHKDLRNVLERASARETAARVAAGAILKRFLSEFHIYITSFVTQIGHCSISNEAYSIFDSFPLKKENTEFEGLFQTWFDEIQERLDNSPLRCPDPEAEQQMMKSIDDAKYNGDSIGGIFQVVAFNVPIGLGSHVHWDRKLDARIAFAIMSIPAIKGVEIGLGFETTKRKGSEVHDEIYYEKNRGFYHKTNNAGGIEGGISNGEPIIVKAGMKPIPTLMKPLSSVDFITKEPFQASKERSDVCAVPAAGIVGEAMLAIEIANAFLEKFGGDNISEIKHNFERYKDYLSAV